MTHSMTVCIIRIYISMFYPISFMLSRIHGNYVPVTTYDMPVTSWGKVGFKHFILVYFEHIFFMHVCVCVRVWVREHSYMWVCVYVCMTERVRACMSVCIQCMLGSSAIEQCRQYPMKNTSLAYTFIIWVCVLHFRRTTVPIYPLSAMKY